MNDQLHKLVTLPVGKNFRYTYPVNWRLCGPRRCYRRFRKQRFLPRPEIEKLLFGPPARGLVILPATPAIPKLCAAVPRDISKRNFFQIMFIILSIVTKFLGQIVLKLFGIKYLIKGKCSVLLLA
jgi:hypothetical protein